MMTNKLAMLPMAKACRGVGQIILPVRQVKPFFRFREHRFQWTEIQLGVGSVCGPYLRTYLKVLDSHHQLYSRREFGLYRVRDSNGRLDLPISICQLLSLGGLFVSHGGVQYHSIAKGKSLGRFQTIVDWIVQASNINIRSLCSNLAITIPGKRSRSHKKGLAGE